MLLLAATPALPVHCEDSVIYDSVFGAATHQVGGFALRAVLRPSGDSRDGGHSVGALVAAAEAALSGGDGADGGLRRPELVRALQVGASV